MTPVSSPSDILTSGRRRGTNRAGAGSSPAVRAARAARRRAMLLVLPLFAFLAAVYFLPVGRLLILSVNEPTWTLDHFRKLIDTPVYVRVFVNTFRLALVVTVVTLVLAYPTAYYLSNASPRAANLMMFFILVPFWTSILVRTYAWMVLLGTNGIINDLLMRLGVIDSPLQLIYRTFAVGIGMVHVLLPFMILPLYSTMRGIDRSLLQAASSLGAKPYNVFLRVFLPLSLPGIVAGSSIVFVFSLGFYITPALLGGRRDLTIAMLIGQQFNALLNWGFGAALSVVLLVVAVVIMVIFNRVASADRLYGTSR